MSWARFLFYDPILSEDSTVSCATCHPQSGVFTDLAPVSTGIFGQMGTRSAMTIVDVGFFNNGLFWDGRIHTLEEQVIDPVVSPFEMGEEWFDIEDKLQRHPFYPEMIRRAFGILNKDEIDRSHVTASISQFMRTIVNQGNSKFDKVFAPGSTTIFTDEELNGYDMFLISVHLCLMQNVGTAITHHYSPPMNFSITEYRCHWIHWNLRITAKER